VFRGLPYAAPPVGERRWREPQEALPWPGIRAAVAAAPSCPQKRGLSLEGGGDPGRLDEDCLYVNVFVPRERTGSRLPVMVWLHGGALIFGGGALPIYDGSALAARGAVVVTINYRLGPLGYFSHAALERERPGGPMNFGLLDQIAALRWVRANIDAFGGDPSRVTVLGQSAGAQSVLALMASPLAEGLFQRAMAQSPYGLPSHTRAKARAHGAAVATAVGLAGERASLAALRAMPAERLATLEGPGLSLAPSLIVGDDAMPRPLLQAFQEGRQAAVPLVIGSNSDDASVVLAFGVQPAQLVRQLGRGRVLVRALYPGVADDTQLGREVARDAVFTAFARRMAYLHSRKAPAWRYYFSVAGGAPSEPTGAGHGAEVPFVLGTVDRCACRGGSPSALDHAIERRLGDRWFAFARDGRPAGDAVWRPDDRRRGFVLEIGADDRGREGFMKARLDAIITGLNVAERRSARTSDPDRK